MSKSETEPNCPLTNSEYSRESSFDEQSISGAKNCSEKETQDSPISTKFPNVQESNNIRAGGDVGSQTRSDSGCNPENPLSLTEKFAQMRFNRQESSMPECLDTGGQGAAKAAAARNPLTGVGLGEDGVGGWKPIKTKSRRDGNPVTGEGYNKSNDFSNHTPSMNGANQVINKNRIPPGGFSSGLW